MLQAKYSSSYRKKITGTLMFVYIVTGTAKELAAFLDAMMKRTGKPEDELKDENGNPLYWVNPQQWLQNGKTASKTFTLSISRNGAVVEDDTDNTIARNNRIAEKMEDKEAELLVQMKYRIVKAGNNQPVATNTTSRSAVKEAPDNFDDAVAQMQADAAGAPKTEGKPEVKKEPVAAGEENLGD